MAGRGWQPLGKPRTETDLHADVADAVSGETTTGRLRGERSPSTLTTAEGLRSYSVIVMHVGMCDVMFRAYGLLPVKALGAARRAYEPDGIKAPYIPVPGTPGEVRTAFAVSRWVVYGPVPKRAMPGVRQILGVGSRAEPVAPHESNTREGKRGWKHRKRSRKRGKMPVRRT